MKQHKVNDLMLLLCRVLIGGVEKSGTVSVDENGFRGLEQLRLL